jgi:hypothetical protein
MTIPSHDEGSPDGFAVDARQSGVIVFRAGSVASLSVLGSVGNASVLCTGSRVDTSPQNGSCTVTFGYCAVTATESVI